MKRIRIYYALRSVYKDTGFVCSKNRFDDDGAWAMRFSSRSEAYQWLQDNYEPEAGFEIVELVEIVKLNSVEGGASALL